MKMQKKIRIMNYLSLWSMVVLVSLAGCGKSASESANETDAASTESTEQPAAAEAESKGEVVQLVINSNDLMRYDTDELKVPAGSTVELTLNHTGELAIEAMGHNLVILAPGTDIASFAEKAIAAKDNGYIPDGDEVLVHTQLIGGGDSTTITFEAPAAGTYDFICSFPGHWGLMKGKFIVE